MVSYPSSGIGETHFALWLPGAKLEAPKLIYAWSMINRQIRSNCQPPHRAGIIVFSTSVVKRASGM
jgi:hypothetical protein